jgi:tRNA (guanine-N7-)-methyltransferase
MEEIEHRRSVEKLYGRIKSRALTKRQADLFESLLPTISVTSLKAEQLSIYRDISLEIGFGSGEHLFQLAIANPDNLFIGCEFFVNGIASLLSKIDEVKIQNIRIFQGDSIKLIPEIPDNFLAYVFLLFPDPWPKRKHIYRRFVQEKTLLEIHRILRRSGVFRIATDCLHYAEWVNKVLTTPILSEKFSIEKMLHTSRPSELLWPKTRYEQKSTTKCVFSSLEKL